jgi:hypothetical protein
MSIHIEGVDRQANHVTRTTDHTVILPPLNISEATVPCTSANFDIPPTRSFRLNESQPCSTETLLPDSHRVVPFDVQPTGLDNLHKTQAHSVTTSVGARLRDADKVVPDLSPNCASSSSRQDGFSDPKSQSARCIGVQAIDTSGTVHRALPETTRHFSSQGKQSELEPASVNSRDALYIEQFSSPQDAIRQ